MYKKIVVIISILSFGFPIFVSAQIELQAQPVDPAPEPTGIEHEDIGAVDDGDPDQPIITGDVPNPETTGTEIEDIGVTGAAPDAVGGDGEDIGAPTDSAESGYLKIDDIKGESSDSSGRSGKAETTWKIEEGEKAGKPKEIVVVGSKVREDETVADLGITLVELVEDEEDLLFFAAHIADTDEEVNTIRFGDGLVGMEYDMPGRLLGFIPITYTVSVSVEEIYTDEYGRVKVKFPWYSSFTKKGIDAESLEAEVGEGLGRVGLNPQPDPPSADHIPTETVSLNFAKVQAGTLDSISNALKNAHDTAMSIIRKIG